MEKCVGLAVNIFLYYNKDKKLANSKYIVSLHTQKQFIVIATHKIGHVRYFDDESDFVFANDLQVVTYIISI